MKKQLRYFASLLVVIVVAGLGSPTTAEATIVVNSIRDVADPDEGEVTLRSALASAANGESIVFDQSLDGATIELSLVGNEHSLLKGEVMGMRDEPSGPVSYLVGYFERDYGKSALYAQKNVVIDASALPSGITLSWVGGYENPARVLAVYGDLTMTNVAITGGKSVAEELPQPSLIGGYEQLSTRARGAGLAVWGVAMLRNVMLHDNHCKRDSDVSARSRDAGVFGGGIYADIVDIEDSVISGNSLWASGVAGGGVFSVGGAEAPEGASKIVRSAITGNRISGMLGYGGGVYSDGGGIGKTKVLELRNTTIARNVVDVTDAYPFSFVYWRGGGIYMSNGYLEMQSCTVVENEVYGVPRTDALGKPNMAGGIAATIGNAHAVERMTIGHSVIAGNTVQPVEAWTGAPIPSAAYEQDIFTGTLLHFNSLGYNRIGTIDFSQMLVPVGQSGWRSLSRRHYPKQGDQDGVILADVLNLTSGITLSDTVLSVGVDAPNPAVLYYEPHTGAQDQVPASAYRANETYGEYRLLSAPNNFLAIMLGRLEKYYQLPGFAAGFTAEFETFLANVDLDDETPGNQPYTDPYGNDILTLAETQWFGPARTWPKELPNYPYIEFWHQLDAELRDRNLPGMGPELLGDAEWLDLFSYGRDVPLAENSGILMSVWTQDLYDAVVLEAFDQLGRGRPADTLGDIGAYEHFSPPCAGTASLDECGECAGGDTGNQACVQDCKGSWGGTAYMDNCNTCVGGSTGTDACIQDCKGNWGGDAYIDDCGFCISGTEDPCALPGVIIVQKETDPAGETTSFEFSTNYSSTFFLADSETDNSGNLRPGTYSVSEINIPAGWVLSSATCDDGSDPVAIGLGPDETVTCTFINTSEMHTLSIGATENGTIGLDPSGGSYVYGTEVQVTATPLKGYEFEQWSGDLTGGTNPSSIVMDSDKTVAATFVKVPCLPLDARFDDSEPLSPGYTYYTDRDDTLTAVPEQYDGLYMIKTPDSDRTLTDPSGYLTFEMPKDGAVYVAFDRRISVLPNWTDGFDSTGDQIETSLGGQKYLEVFSNEFSAGDCVNFGANNAPGFSGGTSGNYIVFVDIAADGPPVINVQPDDVTVAAGQNATFSIAATGLLPLHYMWTLDGGPVGDDSPSITVQVWQSGEVVCAVSDAYERDTWSRVATLTVLLPKGAACATDSDCFSNKCRGKSGAMTCK